MERPVCLLLEEGTPDTVFPGLVPCAGEWQISSRRRPGHGTGRWI